MATHRARTVHIENDRTRACDEALSDTMTRTAE
jgi:hypothetical protein